MPQFHLTPFPKTLSDSGQIAPLNLAISGQIELSKSTIDLHYVVNGDLSKVFWPEFNSNHQRKNELWKHTCFELFILPINNTRYYEYNLSPSGSWNAYSFDDYRRDQRDSPIDSIEIKVEHDCENKIVLNSSIPLIDTTQPTTVKIGISAVIEDQQHQHHYYALSHMGKRPDFHIKESFIIELSSEPV